MLVFTHLSLSTLYKKVGMRRTHISYHPIGKKKGHKKWLRRQGANVPMSGGGGQCLFSSVLDPDPHSFGCPGSGSVLEMQIRILEHQNWPKLKKYLRRHSYVIRSTVFPAVYLIFFTQKFNFCDFKVWPGSECGSAWIRIDFLPWSGSGSALRYTAGSRSGSALNQCGSTAFLSSSLLLCQYYSFYHFYSSPPFLIPCNISHFIYPDNNVHIPFNPFPLPFHHTSSYTVYKTVSFISYVSVSLIFYLPYVTYSPLLSSVIRAF